MPIVPASIQLRSEFIANRLPHSNTSNTYEKQSEFVLSVRAGDQLPIKEARSSGMGRGPTNSRARAPVRSLCQILGGLGAPVSFIGIEPSVVLLFFAQSCFSAFGPICCKYQFPLERSMSFNHIMKLQRYKMLQKTMNTKHFP